MYFLGKCYLIFDILWRLTIDIVIRKQIFNGLMDEESINKIQQINSIYPPEMNASVINK